jgi:hypothetical protein
MQASEMLLLLLLQLIICARAFLQPSRLTRHLSFRTSAHVSAVRAPAAENAVMPLQQQPMKLVRLHADEDYPWEDLASALFELGSTAVTVSGEHLEAYLTGDADVHGIVAAACTLADTPFDVLDWDEDCVESYDAWQAAAVNEGQLTLAKHAIAC